MSETTMVRMPRSHSELRRAARVLGAAALLTLVALPVPMLVRLRTGSAAPTRAPQAALSLAAALPE
ncbi:MAG: hypothetical protein AB7N76_13625 [Planctomycetota bacterium]